jgi:hypothetical protein
MKFHGLTIQDHDTMPKEFSRLWTAEDSKQFSALSALATQYSALEPLPGTLLMVNLLWEKTLVI